MHRNVLNISLYIVRSADCVSSVTGLFSLSCAKRSRAKGQGRARVLTRFPSWFLRVCSKMLRFKINTVRCPQMSVCSSMFRRAGCRVSYQSYYLLPEHRRSFTYNLFNLGGWKLVSWCSHQKFTSYFYNYNYFLLLLEMRDNIPWSPGGCRSLYCTQHGGMIKSLMTPSTTHPSARRCWSCVLEVPCVPGPSSHCDQIGVMSYSIQAVPWFILSLLSPPSPSVSLLPHHSRQVTTSRWLVISM